MSSELKNKLDRHEEQPPVTAWEKISAELDNSHLSDKFPSLLYGHEEIPPANSWQKISEQLYEENVPVYAATLLNMEVIPPADVWNRITTSLDGETRSKGAVRNMSPFLKYAVAAVVTGLIAYGSVLMLGKKSSEGPSVDEPVAKNDVTIPSSPVITEANKDSIALEQSKNTYASLEKTPARSRVINMREDLVKSRVNSRQYSDPTENFREPDYAISEYSNVEIDKANRYVLLMTPEGNFIRMSKKLGDLVCCVSGEEQDADCVDQIKKWQYQIANSPIAPSPGNFMDILDLLSILKDDE